MLSQFFHPNKYDWTQTVKQDLVKQNINFTLGEIREMKKEHTAPNSGIKGKSSQSINSGRDMEPVIKFDQEI